MALKASTKALIGIYKSKHSGLSKRHRRAQALSTKQMRKTFGGKATRGLAFNHHGMKSFAKANGVGH